MNHSLKTYIDTHKTIHLIGIGGVSMNSLAELLVSLGACVSGSDSKQTAVTDRLHALGVHITYDHLAENTNHVDLVIRTSAIHDDNPEIMAARANNIPIMERAEAWGDLMCDYRHVVCLSGTHGKTTSTSMMTMIALESGLDPTVMVGSHLPAIDGTLRIGAKDCFVAESCEYCNSFLHFHPTVAVLLNVEADHLDFFKDINEIIASFRAFCLLTPPDGAVVVNAQDANAMCAAANLDRTVITFGNTTQADVYPQNIVIKNGYYSFDVFAHGHVYTHISLSVPGQHNMMNALACCAAAYFLQIDGVHVSKGLHAFTGSSRRFQLTGHLSCGAMVVDDYAHHPSEMQATLHTARQMDFKRIICAFQPHTYTRTKALFHDFAGALEQCDKAILAPIYAAREQNTTGISSADLAKEIPHAKSFDNLSDIAAYLQTIAQAGDLILTMGAGDIHQVGQMLLALDAH